MATETIDGEIVATERLDNSVNGNPRYRVTVLAQVAGPHTVTDVRHLVTSSDISDAYEMGNPGYRRGDKVRFTLTRAGLISHMSTLETV